MIEIYKLVAERYNSRESRVESIVLATIQSDEYPRWDLYEPIEQHSKKLDINVKYSILIPSGLCGVVAKQQKFNWKKARWDYVLSKLIIDSPDGFTPLP